jgi:hypothetical protein
MNLSDTFDVEMACFMVGCTTTETYYEDVIGLPWCKEHYEEVYLDDIGY